MPFFDYVNIMDNKDVWEDAFLGKTEEAPKLLSKDGKMYKRSTKVSMAEPVFKGKGWTDNSKYKYITDEDIAMRDYYRNQEADLLMRKIKFADKLKKGDL